MAKHLQLDDSVLVTVLGSSGILVAILIGSGILVTISSGVWLVAQTYVKKKDLKLVNPNKAKKYQEISSLNNY